MTNAGRKEEWILSGLVKATRLIAQNVGKIVISASYNTTRPDDGCNRMSVAAMGIRYEQPTRRKTKK